MDEALQKLNELMLPFSRLIGVEFVSASKDIVTARMLVRPDLCTSPDYIHGGAVMAFADTLGACGTILNLPEGAATTTIESKTNFISSAPVNSTVIGESTPIHRGRRTMVWQTKVSLESGKLIAMVTQTQMVLEPR